MREPQRSCFKMTRTLTQINNTNTNTNITIDFRTINLSEWFHRISWGAFQMAAQLTSISCMSPSWRSWVDVSSEAMKLTNIIHCWRGPREKNSFHIAFPIYDSCKTTLYLDASAFLLEKRIKWRKCSSPSQFIPKSIRHQVNSPKVTELYVIKKIFILALKCLLNHFDFYYLPTK